MQPKRVPAKFASKPGLAATLPVRGAKQGGGRGLGGEHGGGHGGGSGMGAAALEHKKLTQRAGELALVRKSKREVNQLLMEAWLNDAVIAVHRGPDSQLDTLQQSRGALKGLLSVGLSREALKAAGLHGEEVDRLYRSMYVHSIGFYDVLKELFVHCDNRGALLRAVWQSFIGICEKAVKVNFSSDYLEAIDQRERYYNENKVLVKEAEELREQSAVMQSRLAEVTSKLATETMERSSIEEHNAKLKAALEEERHSKSIALQKFVLEVEHRTELQDLANEAQTSAKVWEEDCMAAKDRVREAILAENLAKNQATKVGEVNVVLEDRIEEYQNKCSNLEVRLDIQEKRSKSLENERHKVHQAYLSEVKSKVILNSDIKSKVDKIAGLEASVKASKADSENSLARAEAAEITAARLEYEYNHLVEESKGHKVRAEKLKAELDKTLDELAEMHRQNRLLTHDIEHNEEKTEKLREQISSLQETIGRKDAELADSHTSYAALKTKQARTHKVRLDMFVAFATTGKSHHTLENKYIKLDTSHKELRKEHKVKTKALEKTTAKLKVTSEAYEKAKVKVDTLSLASDEQKLALSKLQIEKEALEEEVKSKSYQVKANEEAMEDFELQIAHLNEMLDKKKDTIAQLETKLQIMADTERTLRQEISVKNSLRDELNDKLVVTTASLEMTKETLAETEATLEATTEKLKDAGATIKRHEAEIADLTDQNQMRKAQLAAADEKIAEQGEHIANTEAALETMTAHRDVLHGENEGRKATIGEQEQKIEELSAALAEERVDRQGENREGAARIKELEGALAIEQEAMAQSTKKLGEETMTNSNLRRDIDHLQHALDGVTNEKSQVDQMLQQDSTVIGFLQKEVENLKATRESLKGTIREKEEAIKDLQKEYEALEGRFAKEKKNLLDAQELERTGFLGQIDEITAIGKANLDLAEQEKQEALHELKVKSMEEIEHLQAVAKLDLQTQATEYESQLADASAREGSLNEVLGGLEEQIRSLAKENTQLERAIEEAKEAQLRPASTALRASLVAGKEEEDRPEVAFEIETLEEIVLNIYFRLHDVRTSSASEKRITLDEVAYDYFIFQLGVQEVGEKYLWEFKQAANANKHKSKALNLFCRLCGLGGETVPESGEKFVTDFFLHVLKKISFAPFNPKKGAPAAQRWLVNYGTLKVALDDDIIGFDPKATSDGGISLKKLEKNDLVNIYEYLDLILDMWLEADGKFEAYLAETIKTVHDMDAVCLTVLEFTDLLTNVVHHEVEQDFSDRLFKEMLGLSEGGIVDSKVMKVVCTRNGLHPVSIRAVSPLARAGLETPTLDSSRMLHQCWTANSAAVARLLAVSEEVPEFGSHAETLHQMEKSLHLLLDQVDKVQEAWMLFRKLLSKQSLVARKVEIGLAGAGQEPEPAADGGG